MIAIKIIMLDTPHISQTNLCHLSIYIFLYQAHACRIEQELYVQIATVAMPPPLMMPHVFVWNVMDLITTGSNGCW